MKLKIMTNFSNRLSSQSYNIQKGVILEKQVLMTELCNSLATSDKFAKHSARDPIISKVIAYVKNGWPSKIEEQFKPYYRWSSELHINLSCFQRGNRFAIPFQFRKSIFEELHDNHPE